MSMSIVEAQAYRGIPVAMLVCECAEWEKYAPLVGGVSHDTVVYEVNDGHPGGTYSNYAEDKLYSKLNKLLKKPEHYKNFISSRARPV